MKNKKIKISKIIRFENLLLLLLFAIVVELMASCNSNEKNSSETQLSEKVEEFKNDLTHSIEYQPINKTTPEPELYFYDDKIMSLKEAQKGLFTSTYLCRSCGIDRFPLYGKKYYFGDYQFFTKLKDEMIRTVNLVVALPDTTKNWNWDNSYEKVVEMFVAFDTNSYISNIQIGMTKTQLLAISKNQDSLTDNISRFNLQDSLQVYAYFENNNLKCYTVGYYKANLDENWVQKIIDKMSRSMEYYNKLL